MHIMLMCSCVDNWCGVVQRLNTRDAAHGGRAGCVAGDKEVADNVCEMA